MSKFKAKIKTILWDFDGVIVDSMQIKGNGFIELFKQKNYDNLYLQKLEKYHYKNGGVSRFDKIKYFYTNIIKQEIKDDEIIALANKFAQIIKENIFNKQNLINNSVNFIKQNYKKYNFHIVSGSEHKELNEICEYFKLSQYFISINGSPITKDILVQNVINKCNYNKKETILIGDALGDYNVCKHNNIIFYGYNNLELKKLGNYIENFQSFKI
jgi:phosphoglycolate phosphatase-like HAD superfamily hydrolase